MAGLIFLVGLFIISFLSPYICKYNYREVDVFLQYLKPCAEHPFGCDEVGRDILVRVLYGAKYTLSTPVAMSVKYYLGLILLQLGMRIYCRNRILSTII